MLSQPGERRARFLPPAREVGTQPLGSGVEDLGHFVSAQPCSLVPGESRKGWPSQPLAQVPPLQPAQLCEDAVHTKGACGMHCL